jgi:hypothetical protein
VCLPKIYDHKSLKSTVESLKVINMVVVLNASPRPGPHAPDATASFLAKIVAAHRAARGNFPIPSVLTDIDT